jgi:hypothetical protein
MHRPNKANPMTLLLQSRVAARYGRNPHSRLGLANHTEVKKAAEWRRVVQPSI